MPAGFQTNKILAVAPMMAWTDRHCRYLHRLYAPSALLFTEMVTTSALVHGDQWRLLDFSPEEHPLALQLGGNDPQALARCAEQAAARGYDEINLNVGCPSDRVQRGTFGACLMLQPDLVARCVHAMQTAVDVPVTVKCRLGVDDHDTDEALHAFIAAVADAGCRRFYVHARKAILGGLTPAQNRDIPPLQLDRVRRLKACFPHLDILVNGGITSSGQVQELLEWADGVMIGRAAYHNPDLLSACHRLLEDPGFEPAKAELLAAYQVYLEQQLAAGARLHDLTRHLLSSCNGLRGARRFRQVLSDNRRLKANDAGLLTEALSHVFEHAA